jgi:hypothetical protein
MIDSRLAASAGGKAPLLTTLVTHSPMRTYTRHIDTKVDEPKQQEDDQ